MKSLFNEINVDAITEMAFNDEGVNFKIARHGNDLTIQVDGMAKMKLIQENDKFKFEKLDGEVYTQNDNAYWECVEKCENKCGSNWYCLSGCMRKCQIY